MAKGYRLEALLKLRQREKKRAEVLLAKRLFELKEAKEKLERLKEEKEKIKKKEKEKRLKMDTQMNRGGLIGEGCFHVNFLRKLKEDEEAKTKEMEEQKGVIQECQEKVVKARKEYFDAIKQLRVMEKHKGLWKKKIAVLLSKKEEKEMDELGQTIHSLRQWRGEKSEFTVN